MKKITPNYIVGLTDGEGSFSITFGSKKTRLYPEFRISVNDTELLEKIKDFFGFGTCYLHEYEGKGYVVERRGKTKRGCYSVTGLEDVKEIKEFFIRHPPRMKEEEYKIWSKAVDEALEMKEGKRKERKPHLLKLAELREELMKLSPQKMNQRKYSLNDIKNFLREK